MSAPSTCGARSRSRRPWSRPASSGTRFIARIRRRSFHPTPRGAGRIQAGATLFDRRKVKSGGVGDRLQVFRGGEVVIGSGDGRELSLKQARNGLRKDKVIEIGVTGAAAIAGPPTRIEGELHEVGEARAATRPRRFAARQRAKSGGVGRIAAPARHFFVRDCPQLVVLHPQ